MAKKKTTGLPNSSTPAPARRRAAAPRARKKTEPAAPPVNVASVSPTEPIDAAADLSRRPTGNSGAGYTPAYSEIAEAAYRRYLSRGRHDGRDFDDWIEAERELRERRTR